VWDVDPARILSAAADGTRFAPTARRPRSNSRVKAEIASDAPYRGRMGRQPSIGKPLPAAHRAYASVEKWTEWILAERGHGAQWHHVFRVGPQDRHVIWVAIAHAIQKTPVMVVRDRGRHGVVCGVAVTITLRARTAVVMTSWHYGSESSAPRLVTAYPVT